MFNLFDIMRGAQGGAAIDTMARQFGLTPDQVERAMQALLPAFTLGLQGSAREPDAFARTLGLMGSGRYAPFFDNPALAFSQGAMAEGNEALQALFGSKDVSSSVAREAAIFAGIGPEILKQMLPILASILLGGVQRSGQAQGPRRDESGGRGGIFEQILDALRGGSETERPEVDRRPRRERPRDREPGRDRAGRRAERPERPRRERSTFPESRQEEESAGGGWGDVLADILRGPLPSPTGDADQPGDRTRGPRPGSFDDEMSRRINPDRRPPHEPRREPWPPSDREAPAPRRRVRHLGPDVQVRPGRAGAIRLQSSEHLRLGLGQASALTDERSLTGARADAGPAPSAAAVASPPLPGIGGGAPAIEEGEP